MGLFDQAKRLLRRGLAISRRLNACEETAFILDNLGIVADRMGQYARAERLYQAGLAMSKDIGDRGIMAQALFNLGEVIIKQGAYGEARRLLQERAARIQDEAQRRSYLEHVPFHREIVREWAAAYARDLVVG